MPANSSTALSALQEESRSATQRRTMRVLSVAQIFGSMGIGAGASVGVLLAEDVTHSEVWASLARTSTLIGASLIAIPLATMAARVGRRKALGTAWTAALAGAVFLIFAATTKNIVALVLGTVLTGAGTAGTLQARFAATDCALARHRARALSTIVWVGTIGSVLGPNIGAPGRQLASALSLGPFAGAYVIAAVFLALTVTVIWLGLRPDPLLTSQRLGLGERITERAADKTQPARGGAFAAIRASRQASFALLAMVLAQGAMVAVMTMTPVHLTRQGDSLEIIGMTISLHVLGMFAFAPLVGMLSDRIGATTVIMIGQVLFVASALSSLLTSSTVSVVIGLGLLGLAWSFATVPAATLLTESIEPSARTAAQGFADMATNAVGAACTAGAGAAMMFVGFSGLSFIAGAAVIPVVVVWALQRRSAQS